jgi:hypothetical protein
MVLHPGKINPPTFRAATSLRGSSELFSLVVHTGIPLFHGVFVGETNNEIFYSWVSFPKDLNGI